MRTLLLFGFLLIASNPAVSKLPSETSQFTKAEPFEHLPGGQLSHSKAHNRHSFNHPSSKLDLHKQLDFKVGQAIFEKIWVFAPASTKASDGLGPLYNARSCAQCHIRNGRGQAPEFDVYTQQGGTSKPSSSEQLASPVSLFLRLSIPAQTEEQKSRIKNGSLGFVPEPTYGQQLQTFAYPGGRAEGSLSVTYSQKRIELNEGDVVYLNLPKYEIENFGYGDIHPDTQISPRMASPMIGLGLLEAIDEKDLKALADPDDLNQDGISGKLNQVWNVQIQRLQVGRFGWKAGQPNLHQQNSAALHGDIGIGSALFPSPFGDCTDEQATCLTQANGNTKNQDGLEASNKMMSTLTYFSRHVALPTRSKKDIERTLAGKKLFYQSGCTQCHTPKFITGYHPEDKSLSKQLIWPYSDLLLHDMGEGLADNRPEFRANGREWRTPPLWGIGVSKTVGGENYFLHDGRARSLLEAILWHGGEAEQAKQRVISMTKLERQTLIEFLESL